MRHFITLNNLPCCAKNRPGVAVSMVSNQTRGIEDQRITGIAVALDGDTIEWFSPKDVEFQCK